LVHIRAKIDAGSRQRLHVVIVDILTASAWKKATAKKTPEVQAGKFTTIAQ